MTRRISESGTRALLTVLSISISGFVVLTKILASLFVVDPQLIALLVSFIIMLFAALSFYVVREIGRRNQLQETRENSKVRFHELEQKLQDYMKS